MRTLFYDDEPLTSRLPRSIFLAGPTGRDVVRTPWRAEAVEMLRRFRPEGIVILPEFADRKFDHALWKSRQLRDFPPMPGMRKSTQAVLEWETACIDHCDVLLAWMPFSDDLPGRTTRCEVARAIEQMHHPFDQGQLVLGIPDGTDATGHIRYHANRAGVRIHSTLRECCLDAAVRTRYYGDNENYGSDAKEPAMPPLALCRCGGSGVVSTMSTAEDYRPCGACEKQREALGQVWDSTREEWKAAT